MLNTFMQRLVVLATLIGCTLACVDVDSSFCALLSSGGHCTPNSMVHNMLVIDYCKKTCNNCGGGGSSTNFPSSTGTPGGNTQCGRRPLASMARVVNGQIAAVGDWGWSVSITRNGRHFCGGIFIDNEYILSAAHCFQGGSASTVGVKVDIGVHNKDFKESWVQNRGVVRITSHASYNGQQFTNDIAILKFDRPVTYDGKYVIPACLPPSAIQSQFDYQGKQGTVTGWGDQRYQSNQGSQMKREGRQDILSDSKCTQKYAQFRLNPVGQICAGETTQYGGACQGDSGGPFVVQHTDGLYYAYGVVSFGLDCGYGTVYTRVSNYLSWIKQNMY